MADGGSPNVISLNGMNAEKVVSVQGNTGRPNQVNKNRRNNNRAKGNKDPSYAGLESDGRPVYETSNGSRSTSTAKGIRSPVKPDVSMEFISVADPIGREMTRMDIETFEPEAEWISLSDTIKIEKNNPLKKGTMIFRGKKKFLNGWHDMAIKLIPLDQTSFKEVEFLLKLGQHSNVILVYDADVYRQALTSYIYIVMEFCPQTLKDYIDGCKAKKIDFVRNWSYAKQLVEGVAYIHKHNIVHRDIKLENILLTKCGDYLRVADFGISKQMKENQSVANITSRGMGIEGFQAPEMLQKCPTASFYSDAYSIGIVLSLLFSNGYHPFGSDQNRWRTNIIDQKGLDLSHIVVFDKPYTAKRTELITLIKLILIRNPRNRPRPTDMLGNPFFERPTGAAYGIHGNRTTELTSSTGKNKIMYEIEELYSLRDSPLSKARPPNLEEIMKATEPANPERNRKSR